MGSILKRPSDDDIRFVCRNMREVDAREQFARRFPGDDNPEALARDMIAAVPTMLTSVAFHDREGHPATILSARLISPGVARLHRISTARWDDVRRIVFRYGVEAFMPVLSMMVRRAECEVMAGHALARTMLCRLGFSEEGVLRRVGRNNEDFVLMAWVKPDV